jgi:hypothetical protein
VQARPLAAAEALETAAHDRNWGVDWIRRYPDYARLLVTTEHASLLVDLALETVELPPATTVVGPTIAEQEVAVGKLIALFDRAEDRDFVDVLEFCQRYEPALLLELAVRRDAGLGPRPRRTGVQARRAAHRSRSARRLPGPFRRDPQLLRWLAGDPARLTSAATARQQDTASRRRPDRRVDGSSLAMDPSRDHTISAALSTSGVARTTPW